MTAEHLLEAMGLLDDDLIQEADVIVKRRPVNWRGWGSLAACAVLVIAIGYALPSLWMNGGSNNSSTAGAGPQVDAANSSGGASYSGIFWPQTDGEPSASEQGAIFLDSQTYFLTGEIVEELPEGCAALGELSDADSDAPSPSTTVEAYVGCALWQGADGLFYVQLPGGGYAVAERAEP